jgi:hypothetical protein
MLRLVVSLALLLVSAAAFAGEARAQAPVPPMPAGWITIARGGGCKVWNPAPHGAGSVSWTGECVAGQASGRGTLQWMISGNPTDRYEGDLYKGKMHGSGVLQYADGRRYEGGFRDGQRSGRGTLTYPNGIKYVGDWKADRPHGRGTLTAGTDTYSGGWIDGCFKEGSQKAWLNKTPKECGFD